MSKKHCCPKKKCYQKYYKVEKVYHKKKHDCKCGGSCKCGFKKWDFKNHCDCKPHFGYKHYNVYDGYTNYLL